TKSVMKYKNIDKSDYIESYLKTKFSYQEMNYSYLDKHRWNLVDKITGKNIQKIEGQLFELKKSIRTGIATLKDEVYMVEKDDIGFFKYTEGKRYDLDAKLIKELYKIPELKKSKDISEIKRYIIFPYQISN